MKSQELDEKALDHEMEDHEEQAEVNGQSSAFPTMPGYIEMGITIREMIAKDCMAALLSSDARSNPFAQNAQDAVAAADALLLALVSQ